MSPVERMEDHEKTKAYLLSEERYRSLFEQMTEGFALHEIICDEQGQPCDYRFLDINPAFEQLTGLKRSEVIGKTVREILPGEDPRWIEVYGAVALTGQSTRFESQSIALHKHYDVFAYRPAPRQFAVMFTDVTERKRTETALQESEERLRLAAQAGQFGTYDYDFVANRLRWSPELKAIWGLRPDDPCPSAEDFVHAGVHPDDRATVAKTLKESLSPQGSGMLRIEHRIVRPDGSVRWVLARGQVFFSAEGEARRAVRAVGIFSDITDRKRAEQERLEMERRLLHAQKLESIGVLAGGIAHDFNNILAGIMGYAELLKRSLPPSEPAQADIDVIKNSVQRAADLTRQMLAYSGKGKIVVESVDLSRVVEDTKKMLAISVSKKATLTYDLAADLPMIQADASQMYQVVMNLVINASEALGEQGGLIAVSSNAIRYDVKDRVGMILGEDLPEGLCVCLEIADSGCGMDRETVARIFDPFFTTKFTGRGLGLAAVHGIVRGHKGAIQVLSEPGEGTRFRVLFPARGTARSAAGSDSTAGAWHGSGMVLVVDDEEIVRNLANRMIEQAGFSVLTAHDGEEAIRLYRKHRDEIDCVVLDLTMPKMNGEETFRALREIRPDVRVILSSGYPEAEATERFAGHGLAGFIQKPYRFDTLMAKIREAVGGRKAEPKRKPL